MRIQGIAYDTGFVTPDGPVRPPLDPGRVERELTIIRDDLHCTAVQLVGGDPDRLEVAARLAAGLGLEVWFSPYPIELTEDEILALFVDCADRAERLRAAGADVVFVAGVELTIMNRGFLEGEGIDARLAQLFGDPARTPDRIAAANDRLAPFLSRAVAAVRERFGGRVTYAAIQYERVDWDLFDVVTVELIRSAEVAGVFREGVRRLVDQPTPVAITGFGTATWKGAADVAPRSMEVLERDEAGVPVRLSTELDRDEAGQAAYLTELLEIFDGEGVDAAFVHLFALDDLPHRPDGPPREDLDLASPGVVKVLEGRSGEAYPGLPWEPKEAFAAVAAAYRAAPTYSAR